MKKVILLSLLILTICSGVYQNIYAQNANTSAALNKEEQKVMDYIDANMPRAIALLKESVNINSGTLNIAGVKKVGEIFAREFEKANFKTQWISMPDSLRRAGHLVATTGFNNEAVVNNNPKRKKLFLIGHLDTVFEPDMPANPFTMLNDSTATGQGVNDMKGGDVVMIIALQALHAQGLLKDADIIAYLTGDEEHAANPREISRGDFIERAKQTDIALAFEGASGLNSVATARRGASGWSLNVKGKTGHSAGVFSPNAGYGAIYEAARIVNEFRVQLSTEKYLTFNPGVFIGGSEMNYDAAKSTGTAIGKTNIISPAVIVTGDLRFLTEEQKINARKKMSAIVANNLAGTKATIKFTDGIPSMAPTEGNNKLLEVISGVTKDMGLGVTMAGDPGSRGAGDISYIAAYVDCIDGLGASGKGAHAPGETINLKELPFLIKRAALTIYRLSK
ncbi:MAG: M20 family peptidase [Chitinophagia bacterium]|jgi:glutamate carboxypeptidase|nr:M20 family peptidase [Chitinophagia bacterium]